MRRVCVFKVCLMALVAVGTVSAALPTCGAACTTNGDCVLSQDGCSVCRNGKCAQQCGASCNADSDCGLIPGVDNAAGLGSGSTDGGCTLCYFNQCGSQYCGSQCTADSQCAANPLCKVCSNGACAPPPTPKPSVPPTPHPPTPPPTPAPGKAAWGAVYCAGGNCGTSMFFNFGTTLEQAEAIASESTPTWNGPPYLYAYWTQPLPCAAQVLDGSFNSYFVNSTDLGIASTQAVQNCQSAGHQDCFLSWKACAEYPPNGSKWGAIATVGSPESNTAIELDTNNGDGYDTWQQAMSVTMNSCNSKNGACGLTAVFYNCMAFATTSDGDSSVNFANSLSAAKSAAVATCNFLTHGTNDCAVRSSACIAPFHESNDHTVTGMRSWRGAKHDKHPLIRRNHQKGPSHIRP